MSNSTFETILGSASVKPKIMSGRQVHTVQCTHKVHRCGFLWNFFRQSQCIVGSSTLCPHNGTTYISVDGLRLTSGSQHILRLARVKGVLVNPHAAHMAVSGTYMDFPGTGAIILYYSGHDFNCSLGQQRTHEASKPPPIYQRFLNRAPINP